MTFGSQGKFRTTFRTLAGFDKCIFAAAHNKAVGQLQISAVGVEMNAEEVVEQWLDMEEESDECDCSSES